MKQLSVVLFLFLLHAPLSAQTPNATASEQMKKLDFLVGQWRGEGWIEYRPGQRVTVVATESVQRRLGGEVLLVEGIGRNKIENEKSELTGHDAIALMFFDSKTGTFRFQAHRARGTSVDTELKVTQGGFEWGFQDERAGTLRFTMKLTDKGEWFEIGEMSRDGKTWYKFVETTLQRVK